MQTARKPGEQDGKKVTQKQLHRRKKYFGALRGRSRREGRRAAHVCEGSQCKKLASVAECTVIKEGGNIEECQGEGGKSKQGGNIRRKGRTRGEVLFYTKMLTASNAAATSPPRNDARPASREPPLVFTVAEAVAAVETAVADRASWTLISEALMASANDTDALETDATDATEAEEA